MLLIKEIIEHRNDVINRLAKKHFDATSLIDELIALDEERRLAQQKLDSSLSEQKVLAKQIGELMKKGLKQEAEEIKQKVQQLKDDSRAFEETKKLKEERSLEILLSIPNLPHHSVPEGKSSDENEIVKVGGTIPTLNERNKLPHWEIAKKYDLVDFELGVKISGAGFPVYKGKGARLQRALINFFLEEAVKNGFTEIEPPFVVNEDSGYGTGQLPDKEGQMYHVQLDNLYLIPTAEVPITNIYRDVILDEKDLPIKNVAFSACFRREAGSYGKDVRGLNRLHQFNKVEIVCIEKPEFSYERLQQMVDYVQSLVDKLGLPWRILRLCGGDLSFTSALTFDFEVFSAAQERWLEVSSVSNFESYQANRMKCRYRSSDDKKTVLCHTLNGSALALPRIVAALLENNQTPEGIVIPEVLRPYTGFDLIN